MKAFKKICLYLLIITFVMLVNTALFAKEKEIKAIQFSDGSVVQGNIIEINTSIIKIEAISGKIIVREFDDILSIKDYIVEEDASESPFQRHTWELRPEISYIKYEEPGVMKESGFMYGIGASYTYHNNIMIKAEGRYSYGQVDYENSGTIDNIDDYIIEVRGLAGYDFKVSSISTITPYIGAGYRYLNDDMAGRVSSTGAAGYERESNYYYSPIGIETFSQLSNGWSYGINIEFDIFWKGEQKSHLSDADASYNDLENDQNDGYGWRGSVRFQRKGKKADYSIEPFIRYWNIKKSEKENWTSSGVIIGYGYEPKNNSTEFGLIFSIRY